MRISRALGLLVVAIAALASWPLQAHTRSQSYSDWQAQADGSYRVSTRMRAIDLTRIGLHPDQNDFAGRAAAYLTNHLYLQPYAGECRAEPPHLSLRDGWLRAGWIERCPPDAAVVLHADILAADSSSHMHMVSYVDADGRARYKALVGAARAWPLGRQAYGSGPAAALEFLRVGLRHIAGGWDHLAFLLGLLLVSRSLATLAVLITGFTLGHSLTLAAAALGLLQPAAPTVEAMIALSIVLVAAEYAVLHGRLFGLPWALAGALAIAAWLLPMTISSLTVAGMALFAATYLTAQRHTAEPQHLRVMVAVAFGLFHGFGFGGSLAGLHWPEGQTAWALAGFNAGVEFGQVALLAFAWPLLSAARLRWPALPVALNSALAGVGSYWFVLRALA